MGLKEKIEEKIRKKEQEREDHQRAIAQCDAAIEAYRETMKLVSKDDTTGDPLRQGSLLFKAREAIRGRGKPLHVDELLREIGKPVNKKTKVSLAGSLASYVRKGEVFTRTAPNTFGLRGSGGAVMEPPPGFGKVTGDEEVDDEMEEKEPV